MGKYNLSISPE